jgi:hypothetical protein
MINNSRRAFDLRHQKEMSAAQELSDREWDGALRFRDWKSKKAIKNITRHGRLQKDAHVLETVISDRNEHLLDAMRRANREVPGTRMVAARELPVEIRAATRTTRRSFFWGI